MAAATRKSQLRDGLQEAIDFINFVVCENKTQLDVAGYKHKNRAHRSINLARLRRLVKDEENINV